MINRRYFLQGTRAVAVAICLGAFLSGIARAAPKPDLWTRWTAHQESSTGVIDHEAWAVFLQRFVEGFPDGINRVHYDKVGETDRRLLDDYVEKLSATEISRYRRSEQLAYWINFYNALTVRLILEHLPVESILDIDISPGFFANGPWDKKLVRVEGEELSLNDIEHRILRPIWKDPRVHYAVNCASLGCPNLMRVAFTAANTESLLERGAKAYVNHPRGVSEVDGELVVSSIYHWFKVDFGDSDAGVISHLRRFADPETRSLLDRRDDIGGHDYDWSLNSANGG